MSENDLPCVFDGYACMCVKNQDGPRNFHFNANINEQANLVSGAQ